MLGEATCEVHLLGVHLGQQGRWGQREGAAVPILFMKEQHISSPTTGS